MPKTIQKIIKLLPEEEKVSRQEIIDLLPKIVDMVRGERRGQHTDKFDDLISEFDRIVQNGGSNSPRLKEIIKIIQKHGL